MKLMFRGNVYEISTLKQFSSNSIGQPKIKLTYRGQTYCTTPSSAVVSKAVKPYEEVTLVYRGIPYEHTLQFPNLYC